jgi:hypothetical protein
VRNRVPHGHQLHGERGQQARHSLAAEKVAVVEKTRLTVIGTVMLLSCRFASVMLYGRACAAVTKSR